MSTCNHELYEREVACADSMCPLCLAAEVESLRSRLAEAEADNARLVAANKARDEFLRGHRYKHSEVDGYIDLCESQMADLKAQLAEAERTIAALSGFKP